jgi:hypothetical protein
MTRRCASAWCHAEAEPEHGLCEWCYEHRGNHVDGSPRDPRHPWFERGRAGPPPPDPLRPYFSNLMQPQPRSPRVFRVPPR